MLKPQAKIYGQKMETKKNNNNQRDESIDRQKFHFLCARMCHSKSKSSSIKLVFFCCPILPRVCHYRKLKRQNEFALITRTISTIAGCRCSRIFGDFLNGVSSISFFIVIDMSGSAFITFNYFIKLDWNGSKSSSVWPKEYACAQTYQAKNKLLHDVVTMVA